MAWREPYFYRGRNFLNETFRAIIILTIPVFIRISRPNINGKPDGLMTREEEFEKNGFSKLKYRKYYKYLYNIYNFKNADLYNFYKSFSYIHKSFYLLKVEFGIVIGDNFSSFDVGFFWRQFVRRLMCLIGMMDGAIGK